MTIYYVCPDFIEKSAGMRTIYRHIDVLNRAGMTTFVLHVNAGFRIPDMPPAPVRYLNQPLSMQPGDVIVVPEAITSVLPKVKNLPVRKMVLALNWDYVFEE